MVSDAIEAWNDALRHHLNALCSATHGMEMQAVQLEHPDFHFLKVNFIGPDGKRLIKSDMLVPSATIEPLKAALLGYRERTEIPANPEVRELIVSMHQLLLQQHVQ